MEAAVATLGGARSILSRKTTRSDRVLFGHSPSDLLPLRRDLGFLPADVIAERPFEELLISCRANDVLPGQ